MPDTSPCPICGTLVRRWERYPNLLCASCAGKARDEQDRPMRFGSDTPLGGGFVAEVEDGGVWLPVEAATLSAACWVEGRLCEASEHRFGGIAVQLVVE